VPGHRLIISVLGKDPSQVSQLFPAGQPTRFLYLGVDFFKRNRLERQLGSRFSRLDITELHDRVAREIRAEHVEWIDQLNRKYGGEVEWWFNTIASRNIYLSNLFQYSCYLEILERLWNGAGAKPELIFVETPGLAAAVHKWAGRRGMEAQVISARSAKLDSLSNYWAALLRYGYSAGNLLMRQLAAYASRKKWGTRACPAGKLAIIDTFLHDSSVDESGVFHDAYFPYLYDYLEKNGYQVLVHPILYGFSFRYFSIYRRLRQSRTYFLIPEDYLGLADYLRVLTYPLRAWRRTIRAPAFRTFDLGDIIREEQAKRMGDNASLLAGLVYRLFVRLGRAGVRPRLIISWYENQLKDKAMVVAARQVFPEARIIGAQIFIYSSNLLFMFPIQSEVEAGVTPHVMLTMSEPLCRFVRTFSQDIPCRVAASLRYAYLFRERHEGLAVKKGATVLVLLPHDMPEAAEMLEILNQGLDRMPKGARWLIKCHPDYSALELKQVVGERNWPERFEIYQGTLVDAFRDAAVAISSNSSAIVEAAAMGIPVIFLGRQTALNQNVLEDVKGEFIREGFTTDELAAAVNKSLAIAPEADKRYKAFGEEILNRFFSPVTPETMRPFLGEDDI
jgi:hypothetical protein